MKDSLSERTTFIIFGLYWAAFLLCSLWTVQFPSDEKWEILVRFAFLLIAPPIFASLAFPVHYLAYIILSDRTTYGTAAKHAIAVAIVALAIVLLMFGPGGKTEYLEPDI